MATLEELRDLVKSIIQDTSFTDDDVDQYLNDGVAEIAAGMDSAFGDFLIPPLPELFTIGTVTTDVSEAYVAMPATFDRALVFAADGSGIEVDISNSWIEFAESNPLLDRSGTIHEVIEQGGNLYYQGIPTAAETVTLHFYRLPVAMSLDASTPDGIPLAMQKKLLVSYACKEIFSLIEDGIENAQVNTAKHTALFTRALKTLEMSIPADTRSMFLGD